MTRPVTLKDAFEFATAHHRAGRLEEAERIYRQILSQVPDEPDAFQLLGLIAIDRGRPEEAVELIGRAVSLKPGVAAYHSYLGIALKSLSRFEEALAAYQKAIRLKPDYADAHYNQGNVLRELGRMDEAVASYRTALELKPDSLNVYTNLAAVFQEQGLPDEAVAAYENIIRLRPDAADAHDALGFVLALQGQIGRSLAAYRRAIDLRPDVPEYHSHLIQTLLYDPDASARSILDECRRWNARHAEPLSASVRPHPNDRSPERRLRIGYASSNFRTHACAFYTEPLLACHDRQQFEVFCYADLESPDAITARIQSHADRWQNTTGMSDESVAELIRRDGIDILVDLNLHTAGNRLLTFARRPAPVQVSWLGYPGTTGMTAIGYRITDPHLDPPGEHDAFYSEQSVRLADTFWCYGARDDELPVGSLPALHNGRVTFGSMNSFCKVNGIVLGLWARVLRSVPGSRLMILADAGSHRERTLEVFRQKGVDPGRIDFEPRRSRAGYMELYNRLDIALDTWPYNGETTSLDGMWMGVPPISLTGETPASRGGLSILSNVGLPELAVRGPDEYAAQAASLAADLDRLADLRATLRGRMLNSPVMNAPRFARQMEGAYRAMWRAWCGAPT